MGAAVNPGSGLLFGIGKRSSQCTEERKLRQLRALACIIERSAVRGDRKALPAGIAREP